MDAERIIWVFTSFLSTCVVGIAIYFVRSLVSKTEKTIEAVTVLNERIKELGRLEKRIEAIETVTANLNHMASSEFARLTEQLKWISRNRLK